MAQNDALQYGIKFVLDTQGMSAIVKQVEGTFKNLQLNLTAKNINISGLQEQFSGFEKIIKQLQAEFSKIGSTATSGDFTSMKGVINDVSKNVGKLTEQLVTLNQGLTSNLSNAVSAAMKESSGAIKQVVQDVNTLKATLDGVTAKVVVAAAEVGKETAKSNKFDVEGVEKAQLAYSNLSGKVKELYDIMMRVGQTPALNHLTDSGENLFARLRAVREELMNIMTTGQTSKGLSFSDFIKSSDFKAVEQDFKVFVDGARQQIRALDRETAKAEKNAQKAVTKTVRNEADAEITRLNNLMKQLRQLQSEGLKGNANYKETAGYRQIEQAIQELQKYIELLRQAKREGQDIGNINLDRFSKDKSAATMEQIAQAHRNAVSTAQDVVNSQERMAQAMQKANQAGFLQSQVLSDLKSMATQYLSIWGASSFVKEVAQITGELELQQRSLEVIIGSAGQAQEMFNNIKGLSQMSPFTFQDLLKSTRQLAAFGVQTKDLYDTMKSLSDLGAGLNVDVQRLILAYGHVKSSGVLTGIQRRQFETAGINITGEIAKLYNQRYERAGSDERVTSADIFKKITKREIGFGDVEAAIRSLTEEGGKFYNMQLRQYETLGGKLRNLRNNYNIMLDDIGKKYMELLTIGVDSLNSMMENWRTWEALIKSVTAALVAAKVASLALGKSWASMSAARNAARRMRYEAQAMAFTNRTGEIAPLGATAQAATRFNWRFWQGQQRTMLPPSYAPSVINAEGLNKFQKLRMALHKDVTSFDRAWIAQQLGYSQQYQKHIAGLNGWRLGMERMKVSAQSFFTTMRAGFVSLATNPMMWIGAAIAGITALVNKANEIETAMEHSTESTKRIMKEDIDNINSSLNPIKNSLFDANGNFNKEALDKRGFQATFEELDEIMQNHDPLYKGHLFDLKQMGDESAIIKGMIKDVEDARIGKEMLERSVGAINATNADTGYNGTVGSLGIGTQWSTFSEKMHEADLDFQKFKSRLILDSEEIEAALKEKLPNVYKRWKDSGMEFEDFMTQFAVNIKKPGLFDDPSKEIAAFENNSALDKFRKSLSSLVGDLDGAKNKVKDVAEAIAKGFDPKQGAGANIQYLNAAIKNLFSQEGSEVKDPEMQQYFVDLILANLPDDSIAPQIRTQLYETILKANLSDAIQAAIKDGSVDPNNVDANGIADIESRFNIMAEKLAAQNPDKNLRAVIRTIGQNLFKEFKSNPAPAIRDFDRSWQKIYNAITDPNDPRKKLIAKFETVFKNSVNDYEFWAEMDKEMKSIRERLAQMRNIYTVVQKVKIKFDAIFDSKGAQKAIDEVVKLMTAKLQQGDYSDLGALRDVVKGLAEMRDMFKAAELSNRSLGTEDREKYENKQAKAAEKAQRAAEKRQREQERAAEKARRAAEKAQRDAERAEQKQWDRDVKNINDMISQLEKARENYRKWQKDLSDSNAARKVVEDLGKLGLVGEGKLFEESDLKDIENYDNILDKIKGKINELENRSKKEGRPEQIENLRFNLSQALSHLNLTRFQEQQAELFAQMESNIDELSRKWSVFNSVIEKTGDVELANVLSGLSELDRGYDKYLGSLQEYIERYVSMNMQGAPVDQPGLSVLRSVDFDKLVTLDNTGIEEYARNLFGVIGEGGSLDMAKRVKSIIFLLKEYKKEYVEANKKAVEAASSANAKLMDYESQIKRINKRIEEQNKLIDANVGLLERDKEKLKELNNAEGFVQRIEALPEYSRLDKGDTSQSPKIVEALTSLLSQGYRREFLVGGTDVGGFMTKIQQLLDKRQAYYTNRENELLDFSTKGRLERELKKLLGELFDIANNAEQERARLFKAQANQTVAQSKLDAINKEFNKNVEMGRRAQSLETQARNTTDPKKKEELNAEAKALREAIAASPATPEALRDANRAVREANIEVVRAEIAVNDSEENIKKKTKEVKDKKDEITNEDNMNKKIEETIKVLRKFSDALNFVESVLDSFGLNTEGLQDALSVVGGGLEGAQQGAAFGDMLGSLAPALGNAGPWGAAIGAAFGVAGALSQLHDKALQRKIDEIKRETEKMSNTLETIKSLRERELGYDNGRLRAALASSYQQRYGITDFGDDFMNRFMNGDSAAVAMYSYYSRYGGGNGYEQELKLLEEQRRKLMEMYDLEDSKKKSNKEELENYQKQIAELDEQIMFFTEDLANQLWGIDLKGWADQLGDALMTAFENGSSAAAAFDDTVQEIMRGIVKNMLTVGILEPAIERLRVKLFGQNGQGGLLNRDDVQGSMGAVLGGLADWFNTEGPALMDAANEFYNGADDMMRQILGYGMRSNESSANTTTSITSTASEETMGIVAGYLSRLSQDVSVERIMSEMFVNGSWPDYIEQVTTANSSLSAIDRNTSAMMEMMRDGNGALYERVENMSRRLDNFANGIDRISVR